MAIVLNEYEWADRMIHKKNLGNKPGETLSRVARYYFENGYSKREVRKLLDQFLVQCNPDASLVQWSSSLDKIVKSAAKRPLIQIDEIVVTQAELARIKSLDSHRLQRVAFTMLCVVKYWNSIFSNNNDWLNTSDKEIFQMANVAATCRGRDDMYGKLLELGFIRSSKKIDNLNVQVLFLDEAKADDGFKISDFRNLGYQYMKYYGGPYFKCEACGITSPERKILPAGGRRRTDHSKEVGRKHKYCPSCAAEARIKQNVDAVTRHRRAKS